MKIIIKIFIWIFLSYSMIVYAQIGDGSIPYSLTETYKSRSGNEPENIYCFVVGRLDNSDLLLMDSLYHLENGYENTFAMSYDFFYFFATQKQPLINH